MNSQSVILFDGICNLCNSAINFVIKRDKKSIFKFATLQSEVGKTLLNEKEFVDNDLSSFVLLLDGRLYTRSTAALTVCRYLPGLWPLLYGFMIVPKLIRDFVYNTISKNRYKWFGKKDECMIPTAELKAKFLNDKV
ncbi:MAG: thiol-disulfide oxidoreductase DCC family protein [Ginsengibacter sp.]